MKRVFCVFIAIVIMLSMLSTVWCYAIDGIDTEYLVNISENEDFADDRVIVVLDNECSLRFNEYNVNSFSNIDCKTVRNLTSNVGLSIENAVDNITQHVLAKEPLVEYKGVSFDRYNQILCIELANTGKTNVISAVNKLLRTEGVLYATPVYKIKTATTSSDPLVFPGTNNFKYWNLTGIFDAWDITQGINAVRVGVLDSGINGMHTDLDANINAQLSRNFIGDNTSALVDTCGHGTMVAGIIGAEANNGVGISGVCWDVELVSLKVSNEEGFSETDDIIEAIDYASINEFDILNLSSGSDPGDYIDNRLELEAAIDNFNGLFVCAAGNENANIDDEDSEVSPASFNLPNLITVGASMLTESNLELVWYESNIKASNYGSDRVHIFAPGYEICTTVTNGGYGVDSGTSLAAPIVTGVAALMLSINPNLSPEEIKHMIIESADDVQVFNNICSSNGRLNAGLAVEYALAHEKNYIGSNSIYHYYKCNNCNYYETKRHDWYALSVQNSKIVLNCSDCGYGYQCLHSDVCYSIEGDAYRHRFFCSICDFDFKQTHSEGLPTATMSMTYHDITCPDCGYTYTESHQWIYKGSTYMCTICRKTSSQRPPNIMEWIEGEEVVAALPPINDEEEYSE